MTLGSGEGFPWPASSRPAGCRATKPSRGVALLPGLLPLAVVGFPWMRAFLMDPYAFDGLGEFGHHAVTVGPAWLNLGIHAAVYAVRAARAASRSETPTDPA